MGERIEDLHVPGAFIGACFAMEEGPAYAARFDAPRLSEMMAMYERRHGITEASKADLGMHMHHHKLLLTVVLQGKGSRDDDWVAAAATNMIWSALHHPALGPSIRRKAAAMLRQVGRTTVFFEIRDGALWFDVTPAPFPSEVKPINDHFDPGLTAQV